MLWAITLALKSKCGFSCEFHFTYAAVTCISAVQTYLLIIFPLNVWMEVHCIPQTDHRRLVFHIVHRDMVDNTLSLWLISKDHSLLSPYCICNSFHMHCATVVLVLQCNWYRWFVVGSGYNVNEWRQRGSKVVLWSQLLVQIFLTNKELSQPMKSININ